MKLKSLVLAKRIKTTVTGVEMFRKNLNEGQAGDNVGLLLRGTKKEDIERGMVIANQVLLLRIRNSNAKCTS